MKSKIMRTFFSALAALAMLVSVLPLNAADVSAPAVPVTMTVGASVANDKRMPQISADDVVVKQGKGRLKVTEWVAAKGDRAGLDLFILIDDASSKSLGSHLDDLRAFINAQPTTTAIGVGYMRNATVEIVQNFTTDHAAAGKALRLPLGYPGAFGSPYLSAADLMKRWPAGENRREILMITDGIDRARRGTAWRGLNVNPDVDSAGDVAMRTGTIIHTIYVPGEGRLHRNYWEATNGQLGIAKLSDVTGGESYYLGLQSPVSLKPYLNQLQKVLDNQYLLSFSAQPGNKAGLQYVSLNTEVAGVEFGAANAVWVPASK
ncbi:MAG TPA: hypothetical protein VMU61_14020 [Candidatus Aquilonibacter sp.]|nr:hypothetical protein [Candidatus Aquilonibacter sp.]